MGSGFTSSPASDRETGQDGNGQHDHHDGHVVAVGDPPDSCDGGDEKRAGRQLGARWSRSSRDRPCQDADAMQMTGR